MPYEFKKAGRAFKWIVFSWKRDDEAVKAEQYAQTKRRLLAEQNQNAKTKREYTEQGARSRRAKKSAKEMLKKP